MARAVEATASVAAATVTEALDTCLLSIKWQKNGRVMRRAGTVVTARNEYREIRMRTFGVDFNCFPN